MILRVSFILMFALYCSVPALGQASGSYEQTADSALDSLNKLAQSETYAMDGIVSRPLVKRRRYGIWIALSLIIILTIYLLLSSKRHKNRLFNVSLHTDQLKQENQQLKLQNQQLEELKTTVHQLDIPDDLRILTFDDWVEFEKLFEGSYPGYITKLKELKLTNSEILFMCLTRAGIDKERFAAILGIGEAAVRVTKGRVRNKLGREKGIDMQAMSRQL